jgi:energy-converting hydrogenase Eha subunit C
LKKHGHVPQNKMVKIAALLAFGCLALLANAVYCQIDIDLPKSEAEAIGTVEIVAAAAAIQRQMRAAMAPGNAPQPAPAPVDELPSWAGKACVPVCCHCAIPAVLWSVLT